MSLPNDNTPIAASIDAEPAPSLARYTLHVIVLAIFTGFAWSAWATVDRVVSGNARLITDAPTITLQPLETALIRDFPAKAGDRVAAGSTVVTLDPTFAAADLGALDEELARLNALVARLDAEQRGLATLLDDETLQQPYRSAEQRLMEERRNEYTARLSALDARERQTHAELEGERRAGADADTRRGLLSEVEAMRSQLYDKQVGSRLQLLDTRLQRLNLEAETRSHQEKAQGLEAALQTLTAERQAFIEERRRTLSEELARARAEREKLLAEQRKASRRASLIALSTPVDAVVLERAPVSNGSVAEAGQTLATLVPVHSPLEVEVHISGQDIGFIQKGDPVRVKLDAFPFQQHGTLDGVIINISPDAIRLSQAEGGGLVYRARVALKAQRLISLPKDVNLSPGMTGAAEIIVGKRTILSYLIYPLTRSVQEAIREP